MLRAGDHVLGENIRDTGCAYVNCDVKSFGGKQVTSTDEEGSEDAPLRG